MQIMQSTQQNRPSQVSTVSKSTNLNSSMKPGQNKQTPILKNKVSQQNGNSFGGVTSTKGTVNKAIQVKNSLNALLNSPKNNKKQSNSLSRRASLTKQTPSMCKSQAHLVVRSSLKKNLKVKD